jgi:hypothetical protein
MNLAAEKSKRKRAFVDCFSRSESHTNDVARPQAKEYVCENKSIQLRGAGG